MTLCRAKWLCVCLFAFIIFSESPFSAYAMLSDSDVETDAETNTESATISDTSDRLLDAGSHAGSFIVPEYKLLPNRKGRVARSRGKSRMKEAPLLPKLLIHLAIQKEVKAIESRYVESLSLPFKSKYLAAKYLKHRRLKIREQTKLLRERILNDRSDICLRAVLILDEKRNSKVIQRVLKQIVESGDKEEIAKLEKIAFSPEKFVFYDPTQEVSPTVRLGGARAKRVLVQAKLYRLNELRMFRYLTSNPHLIPAFKELSVEGNDEFDQKKLEKIRECLDRYFEMKEFHEEFLSRGFSLEEIQAKLQTAPWIEKVLENLAASGNVKASQMIKSLDFDSASQTIRAYLSQMKSSSDFHDIQVRIDMEYDSMPHSRAALEIFKREGGEIAIRAREVIERQSAIGFWRNWLRSTPSPLKTVEDTVRKNSEAKAALMSLNESTDPIDQTRAPAFRSLEENLYKNGDAYVVKRIDLREL